MAMNIEVNHRFRELEARIKALEDKINAAPQEKAVASATSSVSGAPPAVVAPNRKMCPKCGVKPNHFFHVKTCKGQQKEKENGEDADGRRTSNSP